MESYLVFMSKLVVFFTLRHYVKKKIDWHLKVMLLKGGDIIHCILAQHKNN